MDENKHVPRWIAVSSIVLMTLLAVLAQHASRRGSATPEPNLIPAMLPAKPTVQLWLSTQDQRLRLARQPDIGADESGADEHGTDGHVASPADVVIDIDKTYQSIVGFGAAMTDASAWLIQNKMSEAQRSALLGEMFGPPPGLNFNMARLSIGASDFSLQPYTLDDVPFGQTDPQLQHFNVASNLHDIIPVMRKALAINPQLHIVASPWSAPAWMKDSQNLIGGSLLEQYESTYAQYLVKYIDTYRSYGIPIFALTLQNEPGYVPVTYPGMELPVSVRARIIAQYLGPALASRRPQTTILDWDHNWDEPGQPLSMLAMPEAAAHIDGVAWHCYRGGPGAQTHVHHAFPKKDAYITECSGGNWSYGDTSELMWFARDLLLAGLRNWARGVVYWNLALDEHYGPHFGGCASCKGLVTIDSDTGEMSRNDEYYAFAHFSRFVLPGAVRVNSTVTSDGIDNVAFQNAEGGSIVLVMTNSTTKARTVSIKQGKMSFRYALPPQCVATFVWNPDQAGARRHNWFSAL